MDRVQRTAVGVVTAGIAVAALRRALPTGQSPRGNRWLSVTINRSPVDVVPDGGLPPPLDAFADQLEMRVSPAPGDRGTELSVRLIDPPTPLASSLPSRLAGRDPRQRIRAALREAKSLLETGEVLAADAPPTTHDTPGGKLIGLLTRRSGGEGVL